MSDYNKEIEQDPGFKCSFTEHPIIKVIGVGGGGSNAVTHMYKQKVKGVSFVLCNTDRQALMDSDVPVKVLIGEGLGAGDKPEVAKQAAEEGADRIAALFDDETKMVFITAGMGGGTGTGAAPVVAKIAKDKGVLTIGIVTIPFLFEGERKIIKALKGAEEMGKYVDALLIINNERLTDIFPNSGIIEAFAEADNTLSTAARSISELITCQGKINLDFNDVNTTLRNGGVAIISSGFGEGPRRVTTAIQDALNSPLLRNRDVYSSKHILLNIYFSEKAENKFTMSEVDEMREFMSNFAPEIDVIWGVALDDTLGEKVKITILAAGFNVSMSKETPYGLKEKDIQQHSSPTDNTAILEKEYGKDAIIKRQQEMARARYLVLRQEDFDSEEIIALIEHNPTFKRSADFRRQVELLQSGISRAAHATKTDDSGQAIIFS